MPFKVLTDTLCAGWQDCWTDGGKPWRFATREEAEEEIAELISDVHDAVERGDMDSEYSRDNYKIVEVKNGK